MDQGQLKVRTYEHYEANVRRNIVPVVGHVPLSKLRPTHIETVYDVAFKKGLSARSVLHIHRILFQSLKQAVKWQMIPRNPVESVESPTPSSHQVVTPDLSTVAALLQAVEGTDLRNPAVVALGAGLRLGEVFGLTWASIFFEQGQLAVIQTLQVSGILEKPKTSSSAAIVSLPDFVIDCLTRQKGQQAKRRILLGSAWNDNDLVFDRGDGRPVDTRSISRRFSEQMKQAGIRLTFHGLRHAHASLMHASGSDMKTISENMRHSTISITADLYTHLDIEAHRAASRRLQEHLGPVIG
ncbi:MAG: site-specific integrase [Actinomycetota bacterium]|nr:site-specific integrase [Actinomycetota bacterium]